MTEREIIVVAAAAALVLVVVVGMATLHERHYKSRAQRIAEARSSGGQLGLMEALAARLDCVEAILSEDRLT